MTLSGEYAIIFFIATLVFVASGIVFFWWIIRSSRRKNIIEHEAIRQEFTLGDHKLELRINVLEKL